MRRYVSSPILTMTYYLRAVLLHVLPPRSGRAAGRVSRPAYQRLVDAIREVLSAALTQGGTTPRDFVGGAGQPG